MKKGLPIVGFGVVLLVGIVIVYQMFLDKPVLKIKEMNLLSGGESGVLRKKGV